MNKDIVEESMDHILTSMEWFSSNIISVHFDWRVSSVWWHVQQTPGIPTVFFTIRSNKTACLSAWGFSIFCRSRSCMRTLRSLVRCTVNVTVTKANESHARIASRDFESYRARVARRAPKFAQISFDSALLKLSTTFTML